MTLVRTPLVRLVTNRTSQKATSLNDPSLNDTRLNDTSSKVCHLFDISYFFVISNLTNLRHSSPSVARIRTSVVRTNDASPFEQTDRLSIFLKEKKIDLTSLEFAEYLRNFEGRGQNA